MNKNKIILFTVLAIAFLLRIVWIYKFSPQVLTSDPFYYDRTAQTILKGEGYKNHHLFAYRPPIYPYFLAGAYSIFGNTYLPVKIIQAFISVFSCILMFSIVKRLLNENAALFAACLFAFYPQFIKFSGELWTETLFIFLLLSIYLFLYKFQDTSKIHYGIITGILLGIASLTREVTIYFLPLVIVWLIIINRNNKKSISHKSLVIIFSMFITMLPWIARNYIIFKTIIPVSTNGGVNFYMGNNPQATGGFLWRLPDNCVWPDNQSNLTEKEMSVAEIAIYKKCFKEGLNFILKNPFKSVVLSIKKLMILWRPPFYNINFKALPSEALFRTIWLIFYIGIIILSIPAFFFSIRMCGGIWLIFHFWIILISFIHMLTYADSRYFLPIVPALIVFSSLTFDMILNRKKGKIL